MGKIKKLHFADSDFELLNKQNLNELKGGRDKIGCVLGQKLYACANYEASCGSGFTYNGPCGMLNMNCTSNFSINTF